MAQQADRLDGGKAIMQFMDDAIWSVMPQGLDSPHEVYMKAMDKNRFKIFLPAEEAALANSAELPPNSGVASESEMALT